MHIRAENIEFSIACTWPVSLTYLYYILCPIGIWIFDLSIGSNMIIFTCEKVDTVLIDFIYNKAIGETLLFYLGCILMIILMS